MSYPYVSDFINFHFGTNWYLPIATFGAFVALAIWASIRVAKVEVQRIESSGLLPSAATQTKSQLPAGELVSNLAVVAVIFGVIGARLFHILEYPQQFLDDPLAMIFSRSGLSIYGGLICGGIAAAVYLKKQGVPLVVMLDALAPALALGYGIGRIGCQVSGDGDWGSTSNLLLKPDVMPDWLWAQTYENNIVGAVIPAPGVYPTPLYEAFTAFAIFMLLWGIRKQPYSPGVLFSVYLLLSGFGRLLIEKIRINSDYTVFNVSFTQAEFISVVFVLAGLFGLIRAKGTKVLSKWLLSFVVFAALTACSQL